MISPNDSALDYQHTRDAYNVIPDSARLRHGAHISMELMDKIEARVVALAKSVVEAYQPAVSFRCYFTRDERSRATAFAEMFAARWWATAMWFAKAHQEQGQKISLS